jgi:hypothetical protein
VRLIDVSAASDRLDHLDYFHRLWLANYVANVDILADCLAELLHGAALPAEDSSDSTCSICPPAVDHLRRFLYDTPLPQA